MRIYEFAGEPSATEPSGIHSQATTPPRPHTHLPPSELPAPLQDAERVVLVTGSAGFIGHHVSRALVEQWRATVVGLDNFNDYYDVQLKRDRTNELIRAGVRVYRGDVCDSTLLSHLFSKYQFTDVIHLAAQAGVRHSLEQPVNYIQANVQCFLTLLDTITHQKVNSRTVDVPQSFTPTPFLSQPPSSLWSAHPRPNCPSPSSSQPNQKHVECPQKSSRG